MLKHISSATQFASARAKKKQLAVAPGSDKKFNVINNAGNIFSNLTAYPSFIFFTHHTLRPLTLPSRIYICNSLRFPSVR